RVASIHAALGSNRVIIEAPVADYRQHLEGYQGIDVALDPFPYAGGTTTCEALWMGVPVVTMCGDRYVAHMGESILSTIGQSEWVAADADGYVALARDLAADPQGLSRSRSELRRRFVGSPMCDSVGFAREFERAVRGMWRAWCEAPAGR
ncbi:MAG: hypothetical protein JWQ89_3596, partial [Devosia sp.]|nr:hypothetical protein [Devosia sp.]